MAYYWPQYGVAIEVDDDPYLLPFDEEAFPRYGGLPCHHRRNLRSRVILGTRSPHRPHPWHQAPSRLRGACLLATSHAPHALWSRFVHVRARLYR